MTMHLIQGVNTSSTKKKKPKMTKANMERWAREMQVYNKQAKRQGDQTLTLDQYIDYVHGKGLPKKEREFEEYKPKYSNYRETPQYKSADTGVGTCSAPEPKVYSGERQLLGIATLHKSNAVPVFADADGKEYAKEISRMRR